MTTVYALRMIFWFLFRGQGMIGGFSPSRINQWLHFFYQNDSVQSLATFYYGVWWHFRMCDTGNHWANVTVFPITIHLYTGPFIYVRVWGRIGRWLKWGFRLLATLLKMYELMLMKLSGLFGNDTWKKLLKWVWVWQWLDCFTLLRLGFADSLCSANDVVIFV